jgi:cytosine/adenosine deaminase-related metal-dependent hydrolase
VRRDGQRGAAVVIVRASHALLPSGIERDVVVEVERGRIATVRPPIGSDPPAERGLLVPGLVDAHLHLERPRVPGLVPGGDGLPAWVARAMALPPPEGPPDPAALVDAGAALVCDISNGGDTAEVLDRAGLVGVVQHERLGFGRDQWEARAEAARAPDRAVGRVLVRSSPHATYSTAPGLIRAACRPGLVPASIHLAEDPAEAELTRAGTGPFADLLDRLGLDWRWWKPPGVSPTRYLDQLGVLGPGLLVVHGVHLDDRDRATLAGRGSPLVLCPRSNLHIGGRLPDVPALLASGVALALGTDSLGSSPDLDVLGEIPVLHRAFPAVPLETWLRLATAGGADALGFAGYGRVRVGAGGGLVLLHVDDPRAALEAAPPRSWRWRP